MTQREGAPTRIFARGHPIRRDAFWLLLLLALLPARLAAQPRFARDTELVDRALDLIDRRLSLMPEVAAFKFPRGVPVSDAARERQVIDHSVSEARALRLDPEAARAFFSVQIAMAKDVEEACVERWRSGAAQPPPARDLARAIRPELDAIGRDLLPAVYLASPAIARMPEPALRARLSGLLRQPGTKEDRIARLSAALRALRITAPMTWPALRRIGILRVGTTGDYAPYSDGREDGLHGLDIELAQALAKSWGVSVVFVRTSWPTLMADLTAGRFDLAASGISIALERRALADFSEPYCFDGKMPIARRTEAARFSALEKIDRPGIRVIVNPGGTNERFAREHIRRATLIVHRDNRTIFDELVAGRADVMITDGIEVRLQERRHPELQATLAEPLTHTGKAFLLPHGSELTARLNAWLVPQAADGRIARLLAAALDAESRQGAP